jgi:hypothetical protein
MQLNMKNLNKLIILSALTGFCFRSAYAQVECTNVALNKPATASTSYSTETSNRAFDGDLTTNWSASAHTGWIQVDLQNNVTIDSMKLYVNQYYPGKTIHEIKVSEDMQNWSLVDTLSRNTYENQIITVKFNPVLSNVRGVMINTTSSNSWVAWYEIKVFSTPNKPTITQDGFVLTSSSATNNQWYLNGNPIQDANSQSYTVTATGSYQVGVITGNDCVTMSEIINVTAITTGIKEIGEKDILIYPNPAKDNVIITGITKAKIEVFNFQGQAVQISDISELNTSVDISKLGSGVYSIRLTTNEGIFVKKLFKQ